MNLHEQKSMHPFLSIFTLSHGVGGQMCKIFWFAIEARMVAYEAQGTQTTMAAGRSAGLIKDADPNMGTRYFTFFFGWVCHSPQSWKDGKALANH